MLPVSAVAQLWQFDKAMDVTVSSDASNKFFHHLDSSGRRNIAADDSAVAVTWEDDRDGIPRIYLAYKRTDETAFAREILVSGEGEAYEPSIVALGENRYLVAWEETGQVVARLVSMEAEPNLGPRTQLSETAGSQVSLARGESGLFAIWSDRKERFGRIRLSPLVLDKLGGVQAASACYVDPVPPTEDQLYPTAAFAGGQLVAAWEDRRPKHTIIMAAVAKTTEPCRFTQPVRISEKPEGRDLPYGTGHGVSRVALGQFGSDRVFAAWADKRNFRDGYDIWGAEFGSDKNQFNANEKVQDDFSDLSKQRYATVDGLPNGMLVVAWSDEREGNADVMLSWREEGEWSEDWPLPLASDEAQQSNPTITLDRAGNLHIAWIERDSIGGVTRLKYAKGSYLDE